MKRLLTFVGLGCGGILALVVLLGIIGALIGAPPEETGAGQSSEDKEEKGGGKKEAQKEPPAEEPEPINLSGVGQTATEPFELESGLVIVKMTHQGGANFIVKLLDQSGMPAGLGSVANEIGPFEGSQAVQTRAGQHLLDIQADGPWTIVVEQPRPADAPETTSFSGNSKSVTDFFRLSGGLHRFQLTHQGDANFIVKLLDKNGAPVDMSLVNEIGPFDGSKAVRVPKDDIYLLQVEANGPWTIRVE